MNSEKNLEGNLEDNPVKNKESLIAQEVLRYEQNPKSVKYPPKQKPHPDLGKICLEFYKGLVERGNCGRRLKLVHDGS